MALASPYCYFVQGFFTIEALLTRLIQKIMVFQWFEECEESFKKHKLLLITAHILTLPEKSVDFTIYCNAWGVGLGGC